MDNDSRSRLEFKLLSPSVAEFSKHFWITALLVARMSSYTRHLLHAEFEAGKLQECGTNAHGHFQEREHTIDIDVCRQQTLALNPQRRDAIQICLPKQTCKLLSGQHLVYCASAKPQQQLSEGNCTTGR